MIFDGEPQSPCHFGPVLRELADIKREDGVAGRERIDQRRFPRAAAGARKDHDWCGGLEDRLQPLQNVVPERRELRTAVIDSGLRHGSQHALGRIGRPWDLKEVTAGLYTVERCYRGRDGWRYVHPPVADRQKVARHHAGVRHALQSRTCVSAPAIDVEALRRDLESQLEGDVRFDDVTRALYSTDASVYQIKPSGSSS